MFVGSEELVGDRLQCNVGAVDWRMASLVVVVRCVYKN